MYLFVFAAGIMTAVHLVAGVQRPRPMVIVSGILWLLYAVYEYHVANGTLCDANCNIRVDLALFFPILGLATYGAYQSYMERTRHQKVIGIILGVIVLFVIAATLIQFNLPIEGVALIFAIDQFLDMGRSATNFVGNAVATAVVAKWEGALEPERAPSAKAA